MEEIYGFTISNIYRQRWRSFTDRRFVDPVTKQKVTGRRQYSLNAIHDSSTISPVRRILVLSLLFIYHFCVELKYLY